MVKKLETLTFVLTCVLLKDVFFFNNYYVIMTSIDNILRHTKNVTQLLLINVIIN